MDDYGVKDLVGERFSELRVTRRCGTERGYAVWWCRCSCGAELAVRGDRLRDGRKWCCSCRRHGIRRSASRSRSLINAHPLTYNSWSQMKRRCKDHGHKGFKHYGARGIRVCDRWRDFEAFLSDMGERPSAAHSIERIDCDGHYEPRNCRWALNGEQARNRRSTRYVTLDGRRCKLVEVCEERGLPLSLVAGRLQIGWPLQKALTAPVRAYLKKVKPNRAARCP